MSSISRLLATVAQDFSALPHTDSHGHGPQASASASTTPALGAFRQGVGDHFHQGPGRVSITFTGSVAPAIPGLFRSGLCGWWRTGFSWGSLKRLFKRRHWIALPGRHAFSTKQGPVPAGSGSWSPPFSRRGSRRASPPPPQRSCRSGSWSLVYGERILDGVTRRYLIR